MAGKAEEETEIDLWRKNLAVQMTGSKDEVKNVDFRFEQLAQTRIYDVGFRQRIVDLKTSDKKTFIFITN